MISGELDNMTINIQNLTGWGCTCYYPLQNSGQELINRYDSPDNNTLFIREQTGQYHAQFKDDPGYYFQIPITALTATAGAFVAWIRLPSEANTTIFAKSISTSATTFNIKYIFDTKKKIALQYNRSTSNLVYAELKSITTDWHQIAVIGTGSTWKFYQNGQLLTTVVSSGSNTGKWVGDFTTADYASFGDTQNSSTQTFYSYEIRHPMFFNTAIDTTTMNALSSATIIY